VLLRRRGGAHRAQRPHSRTAPEHRVAPLLQPLRRAAERGLAAARPARGRRAGRRRRRRALGRPVLLAARNILKAWLLVLALVGVFGLVGWLLAGVRGLSIFVFCALLLAAGAYWSFDRVVLGMLGARELPVGEAPLLHSSVERLAARGGIAQPRPYLLPDGLPIAAATRPGARSSRRP